MYMLEDHHLKPFGDGEMVRMEMVRMTVSCEKELDMNPSKKGKSKKCPISRG